MAAIKSGSFYMGSPVSGFFQQEELGRWEDEERRRIIITQPFCIGCYPITQRQFKAVTGNTPSHFIGLDLPVENVSLYDAYFFCNKLNDIFKNALPPGWYFTLPNEVQWEYACRAGTLTALNNGKNLTREENFCPYLNEVAWYKANSQNTTHPVGCKAPNAWGIYDMHGNIWEWTTSKPDPQIEKYVNRGGSWFHDARYCRSAARHTVNATSKGDDIGFRIILTK
jgi:formylglycine-generating enzyme required for sulfatase activity